jgi:hypothetical protein
VPCALHFLKQIFVSDLWRGLWERRGRGGCALREERRGKERRGECKWANTNGWSECDFVSISWKLQEKCDFSVKNFAFVNKFCFLQNAEYELKKQLL